MVRPHRSKYKPRTSWPHTVPPLMTSPDGRQRTHTRSVFHDRTRFLRCSICSWSSVITAASPATWRRANSRSPGKSEIQFEAQTVPRQALDQFRLDVRRYPGAEKAIDALAGQPATSRTGAALPEEGVRRSLGPAVRSYRAPHQERVYLFSYGSYVKPAACGEVADIGSARRHVDAAAPLMGDHANARSTPSTRQQQGQAPHAGTPNEHAGARSGGASAALTVFPSKALEPAAPRVLINARRLPAMLFSMELMSALGAGASTGSEGARHAREDPRHRELQLRRASSPRSTAASLPPQRSRLPRCISSRRCTSPPSRRSERNLDVCARALAANDYVAYQEGVRPRAKKSSPRRIYPEPVS